MMDKWKNFAAQERKVDRVVMPIVGWIVAMGGALLAVIALFGGNFLGTFASLAFCLMGWWTIYHYKKVN